MIKSGYNKTPFRLTSSCGVLLGAGALDVCLQPIQSWVSEVKLEQRPRCEIHRHRAGRKRKSIEVATREDANHR